MFEKWQTPHAEEPKSFNNVWSFIQEVCRFLTEDMLSSGGANTINIYNMLYSKLDKARSQLFFYMIIKLHKSFLVYQI